MEGIIAKGLINFFLNYNVIPKNQYRFLPNISTTMNLSACLNTWTLSVDKGVPTDVLYLDLSKAFNCIPPKRLTLKLDRFRFWDDLLKWKIVLLSKRIFQVCVNSTFSDRRLVASDTTRRSVLGPILYFIYTCYLPYYIKSSRFLVILLSNIINLYWSTWIRSTWTR